MRKGPTKPKECAANKDQTEQRLHLLFNGCSRPLGLAGNAAVLAQLPCPGGRSQKKDAFP